MSNSRRLVAKRVAFEGPDARNECGLTGGLRIWEVPALELDASCKRDMIALHLLDKNISKEGGELWGRGGAYIG